MVGQAVYPTSASIVWQLCALPTKMKTKRKDEGEQQENSQEQDSKKRTLHYGPKSSLWKVVVGNSFLAVVPVCEFPFPGLKGTKNSFVALCASSGARWRRAYCTFLLATLVMQASMSDCDAGRLCFTSPHARQPMPVLTCKSARTARRNTTSPSDMCRDRLLGAV